MILAATDVTALSRRSSVGMLFALTSVPGPDPLRSAGSAKPVSGGAPGAADCLSHADATVAIATIAQRTATVRTMGSCYRTVADSATGALTTAAVNRGTRSIVDVHGRAFIRTSNSVARGSPSNTVN